MTHFEAESAQHVVEHVIVLVAQPAGADLQGHVTVAEVIAGARQHAAPSPVCTVETVSGAACTSTTRPSSASSRSP